MFLVGIAINPRELRKHGHAAVLTSSAGIVMPFCLGCALALFLYPHLATAGIGFMSYALFMGSAMSITAFPVLARILTERNLLHSRMGTLSISCAAVNDITGWCILAYIVSARPVGKFAEAALVRRGRGARFCSGHARRSEARVAGIRNILPPERASHR